ncbi:ribbon-helix-helix protein, CopG family [Maridesulfovibrio sp.]|uniref:ribbon-helix-helix protein, CopG family n=1 Tax=Maridesulfovibrio sp. TaxID=2795000 RepID=UPI003B00830B
MGTVTARIPEETVEKLNELAKATNPSKSFIVASVLKNSLMHKHGRLYALKKALPRQM